MALGDLSSKAAVDKAIREFDSMGRDRFLAKYGFGPAHTYFLVHAGNHYDSKALVGAAHGFQFGKPLRSQDFSGGQATVRPKLESLGYTVVAQKITKSSSALPEEVPPELWEGAKTTVTVNAFERNAKARSACIERYGPPPRCIVCGFDFAAAYGEAFAGFIHVHHTTPLAKLKRPCRVDPTKDLVPVCPNCHAAIHYGGQTRSVDAVRKLVERNKRSPEGVRGCDRIGAYI
jgi:5-methylcytosine-specific restriction protein A